MELEAVRAALSADYEIICELGRGGMAVVYRAREKELDREVAIKVLPAAMTFDSDFVERFQREARTAGKLEHPHIVPIYRVGRAGASGTVIYFVMKLLTGQSLATVLRDRKRLSVNEVRRIILETASALGYAAKRGVVHRDIKPDNILLDSEGRCVVTDFGIAKTASGPMTAAGTSMGTPRYMSPEHAQGGKVDGRSDIYSLGVVAYQCLVGNTPFDADDPFAVLFKHINEPLPRPELQTDEEWALYAVIERMLAKKQEDRYQDADALIQALGGEVQTITLVNPHAVLEQTFGPTEIIPTPLPWRHRRFGPATNLTWAAAAGAVALVLLGAAARAAWGPSVGGIDTIAAQSAGVTTTGAPAGSTSRAALPGAGASTAAATSQPAATKVAEAPAPKPAPPPAVERGSRCPRPGTAAFRRMEVPVLLLDSIRDIRTGERVAAGYDVCGLAPGTPFSAHLTVRKTNQGRDDKLFGRWVDPVTLPFPDVSRSLGTRRRRMLEIQQLPAGDYSLTAAITDSRGRHREVVRTFRILKPEPAP